MGIVRFETRLASLVRAGRSIGRTVKTLALRQTEDTTTALPKGFLCFRSDIELQLMFSEFHYPTTRVGNSSERR